MLWQVRFNNDWPKDTFVSLGIRSSESEAQTALEVAAAVRYGDNWRWVESTSHLELIDKGDQKSLYNLGYLSRISVPTARLTIFDLDDTLIEGFIKPKQPYERVVALPGRIETIQYLLSHGTLIGIATNQGNIAFGYQTEADARAKFRKVYAELGLSIAEHPLHVCFSDKRAEDPLYSTPEDYARRKPSGAMIREIAEHFGVKCNPINVLYIGDRKEDYEAAMDAGVEFCGTAIYPWLTRK